MHTPMRMFIALAFMLSFTTTAGGADEKLVNASSDLSREFYKHFNEAFAAE